MKTILRLVLLGVLLGCCFATRAQTAGAGTITGTVTDDNKAVLPSVNLRIINVDTGIERTVTTTDSGDFHAEFMQPGHYEIIASKDGFTTLDRKNITLMVGQILGIDLVLPVQSVQTTVTVSSAPPVLDTEKTEASQDVSQELVSNLPVNGRRYNNFVLLTPNVAPDGNSGLISYRGVSGIYNTNLVDGANNNQAFFSEARGRSIGAPYVYSQDSINEFQTETASYSAEFGQAAGGQINAVTKSGTNQLHGDLFYYLRYPSLNALDPFNKSQYFSSGNPLLLPPPAFFMEHASCNSRPSCFSKLVVKTKAPHGAGLSLFSAVVRGGVLRNRSIEPVLTSHALRTRSGISSVVPRTRSHERFDRL
jgi:hypothetical protein